MINGADRTLRWFIEDVWGQFDDDHTPAPAPQFPSERKCSDDSSGRVGDDALRGGLKAAATAHLPGWGDKPATPVAEHREPPLLINNQTANTTGRAGNHWISAPMRGQDATLERLRVDRQLEEALTHGPDPLHLAEVFGLDEKTAMRYADSARALLEQAAESGFSRDARQGGNE
ncbi:hypothetical protein RKD49_007926 [Streptomyces glaucescens]